MHPRVQECRAGLPANEDRNPRRSAVDANTGFLALETWLRPRGERTRAVRRLVGERPATGNLVLVTHGANIQALTGINPAPGEFLTLTPEPGGRFRVAGRLAPAAVR